MFRSPLSWGALLGVVLTELALFLWFAPGAIAGTALVGLGVVLLAVWPPLFARSSAYLSQLYLTPTRAMEQAARRKLALETDLRDADCRQGLDQLYILDEKLDAFTRVLERRLSAGEVTYGRYLSGARQLYLASMDNLAEIVVALASVSAVDRDALDGRLATMSGPNADDMHEQERATLEDRRDLYDRQTERIAVHFAENETAMTALTRTAAALAEAKIGRGQADLTVDEAMHELEALAARTKRYE